MINSENRPRWFLAWALLRFPLLLAVLFLLRQRVIDAALAVIGVGRATLLAIDVFSTPLTRCLLACVLLTLLLLCTLLTKRLSLWKAYFTVCAVGIAIIAIAYKFSGRSLIYAAPAVLLLVTNLFPPNINSKIPPKREALLLRVPASEVLVFWLHLRWAAWLWKGYCRPVIRRRWLWALPAVLLSSLSAAALIGGHRLVPIEQALRTSPGTRQIASGDYNWIKVNERRTALFAVGHGFDHLQKFDLSDPSKPPMESDAPVGFPQAFAYSASANEIYIYDQDRKRLLYFDADTLALKRSLDIGPVSPGDVWLGADDRTNTITVVSEADELTGNPFVVVDRSSGTVLDARNEDAGNLTLDKSRSLEYLSFFRRESRVSIYDLNKRAIIRAAPIGPHAERMALWKRKNELLVTLPPQSRIARVDLSTLAVKGWIGTDFGVRAIDIDEKDNLLFAGSIATGRISIIDLSTMKTLRSFYLGPWLRTIEVVPELGIAYVSSNGAIYEVRYK